MDEQNEKQAHRRTFIAPRRCASLRYGYPFCANQQFATHMFTTENLWQYAVLSAMGASDGPRRIFYKPDGSPITREISSHPVDSCRSSLISPQLMASRSRLQTLARFLAPQLRRHTPLQLRRGYFSHANQSPAQILNATLTPAQVLKAMTSTALPSENPGQNSLSGSGINDALNAVSAMVAPTAALMAQRSPLPSMVSAQDP